MKLVIMQPYLFPYVGYFQLLAAADRFVVYDDVNFIKGGWINRNKILIQGKQHLFTIPLDAPSPNRKICDIQLSPPSMWRNKFLQTISQNYRRADYFEAVYALLERVMITSESQTIADLVRISLFEIKKYLKLSVDIIPTSAKYVNEHLTAQQRVIDICRIECATDYINAQGGQHLYDYSTFCQHNLALHFLQPELKPYRQLNNPNFVAGLSIIDVLMNNSVYQTHEILNKYLLIS